jgi:hypothetical protein
MNVRNLLSNNKIKASLASASLSVLGLGLYKSNQPKAQVGMQSGLFATNFQFKQAKTKSGINCSYQISATPDADSNYYDINGRYLDVPIDEAIRHLKEEQKAFNQGENEPDHYAKSRGFPLMFMFLERCKKNNKPIQTPYDNHSITAENLEGIGNLATNESVHSTKTSFRS